MEDTGKKARNFSNTYIFVFSAIMVVIVAALLSFVAEELRPKQAKNVEVEKKQGILQSVGKTEGVKEAKDKNAFVEEEFNKFIKESFVVNSEGELVEGKNAFDITKDLKVELRKPVEQRALPIFVFHSEDGSTKYIIPVRGKGLWGPIWGYVALDSDFNTIYGTLFDHSKETPGLGSEIVEPWFQAHFVGKKIFDDNGNFVSINVVKGGAAKNDPHSVDAITGGTITSKGLEEMLNSNLKPYVSYFRKQKEEGGEL